MAEAKPSGLIKRLDKLNEYERQPITAGHLQGGRYFAGIFSGEHVAATEFVIGALFVSKGAHTCDVIVGLIFGNLLAVLSWALVCAPIAVQTRLTLYWYLRKIGGPMLMVVYNILNAIMYCILAGAMITVSASAIRIPFGIPPQTGWVPTDIRFVLVVLVVGAVVVTLAIWGFRKLSEFAQVCSPWMLLMFIVGAFTMIPALVESMPEIKSLDSFYKFWQLADARIWPGTPAEGVAPLGFLHIAAFAWICNLAMHLGLSDMALLRYARRASYGFYSAFGMYLGHYLAWICAGIMGAGAAYALNTPLTELDSGAVATTALGLSGAIAVVIAGWTTSNPTIYRAGLALQIASPNWSRWFVTFLAGTVTTIVACFPWVFTKLLDFAAIYGLLLMPVGAIVVVEHWIYPLLGLSRYWVSKQGKLVNWPAFIAWGVTVVWAVIAWQLGYIHLFFLAVPMWFSSAILYLVLSLFTGALEKFPDEQQTGPEAETSQAPADGQDAAPAGKPGRLGQISGLIAIVSLVIIFFMAIRVMVAGGDIYDARLYSFKNTLGYLTAVYFIFAVVWIIQKGRETRSS